MPLDGDQEQVLWLPSSAASLLHLAAGSSACPSVEGDQEFQVGFVQQISMSCCYFSLSA